MNNLKYSVLMSVYFRENPEYLRSSILTMISQSVPPDEIIIVKDGPLTDKLLNVLDEFENNNSINVISLEENVGLGKALNIGLNKCRNDLVARMDTDDISLKDRCEKQLECFFNNEKLSVIGTVVAEFIDSPDNIVAYKNVRKTNNEIKKHMKYRNPMNHPSVMFKKKDVEKAGGYQHFLLNEDYYLWIRMMQCGFEFKNIDEPLVKMRITNETYLRRGGWKYFLTQKNLLDYMLKSRFINIFEYIFNIIIRFVTRVLMSNRMRKNFYLKVLRRKL